MLTTPIQRAPFDVDAILTHKFDKADNPLPNGPLVVIDRNGNVVRTR